MPQVVIYTSTICPYCIMAKRLLDNKAVEYTEINVDKHPELRDEMVLRSKRRTVPQIFIGAQHVGGCDDLYALERSRHLDSLLAKHAAK